MRSNCFRISNQFGAGDKDKKTATLLVVNVNALVSQILILYGFIITFKNEKFKPGISRSWVVDFVSTVGLMHEALFHEKLFYDYL